MKAGIIGISTNTQLDKYLNGAVKRQPLSFTLQSIVTKRAAIAGKSGKLVEISGYSPS